MATTKNDPHRSPAERHDAQFAARRARLSEALHSVANGHDPEQAVLDLLVETWRDGYSTAAEHAYRVAGIGIGGDDNPWEQYPDWKKDMDDFDESEEALR